MPVVEPRSQAVSRYFWPLKSYYLCVFCVFVRIDVRCSELPCHCENRRLLLLPVGSPLSTCCNSANSIGGRQVFVHPLFFEDIERTGVHFCPDVFHENYLDVSVLLSIIFQLS